MKKILIVLALLLNVAYGADKNEAYNTVCKGMSFPGFKNSCMQNVKKFLFFNSSAIKVCASLNNEGNRAACIVNIGDKDYEEFEIDQCSSLENDSGKFTCLRDNGTALQKIPKCIKREDLLNMIRSTQDNLRAGAFGSADAGLTTMYYSLINCEIKP